MPHDFDHVEAEAKHLIHESDSDSDEMLTKDEILSKYDLFVGSQVNFMKFIILMKIYKIQILINGKNQLIAN